MTQYMLSVHHIGEPPNVQLPAEELEQIFADTDAYNQKLIDQGVWVFAGGLEPAESTTTVDARGEKAVVTDGPFAESKEYLGGFWIIDVPDLDAALKVAEGASTACREEIRVRPFQGE